MPILLLIILFCLLQYHSNFSPLFVFIVSEAAVCGEAEELEMPTERYIQDLQQALTGAAKNSTNYSFSLTPSPPDSSSAVTLAYEKVQRDISVSISTAITRISDV